MVAVDAETTKWTMTAITEYTLGGTHYRAPSVHLPACPWKVVGNQEEPRGSTVRNGDNLKNSTLTVTWGQGRTEDCEAAVLPTTPLWRNMVINWFLLLKSHDTCYYPVFTEVLPIHCKYTSFLLAILPVSVISFLHLE